MVLKISVEGEDLIVSGKLLHNLGPTTENTRSPLDSNWVLGMDSSDRSADVKCLEVEWGRAVW